jgi:hypothetical protein
MIEKVAEYIHKILENKTDLEKMILAHLIDTEKYSVYLYKKIKGKEPPEELRIAALGHDLERGFRDGKVYEKMYQSDDGFLNKDFLKYHQERSAEILADFLKNNHYPSDKIAKVHTLVSNHETGGDFDSNILKDADSVSFFKNNSKHFIEVKTVESSVKKVLKKLQWMYNRISFNEAKEAASPYYRDAVLKLEKIK